MRRNFMLLYGTSIMGGCRKDNPHVIKEANDVVKDVVKDG